MLFWQRPYQKRRKVSTNESPVSGVIWTNERSPLTVPANQLGVQGSFAVSPEGGCLQCGEDCLPAVQESLPSCLAPALAAAGAFIGVPVPDFGITGTVLDCLRQISTTLTGPDTHNAEIFSVCCYASSLRS